MGNMGYALHVLIFKMAIIRSLTYVKFPKRSRLYIMFKIENIWSCFVSVFHILIKWLKGTFLILFRLLNYFCLKVV